MDIEFETKFYPVDKEKLRKKLEKLGAKLTHPERKMRRIIADVHANPQLKCDYIRVRDEGGLIRLSAKVHAEEGGKMGDEKEVDIEVNDYDKTVGILEAAGLVFNRYQETLRETWEYKGAQIEIDTWPGLLPRLEIESTSGEKVKAVSEKLELDWSKKFFHAMPELYAKVYSIGLEETLEKISNLTFENNPFVDLQAKHNI